MRKGTFWGFIAMTLIVSGLQETQAATQKYPSSQKMPQMLFTGLEVSIGYEHAPITIVMYYSLACPHCHDFQEKVLPQIQKEYIDKGLVRFVFRDFPTNSFAIQAAKIAWCHGKARYLPIAKKLLATQDAWVPKDLENVKGAEKALHDIAIELGITEADYKKCLNNKDTEETILKSSFEAQKTYQINAAPAFMINGEVFEGDLTPDYIDMRLREMGIHG